MNDRDDMFQWRELDGVPGYQWRIAGIRLPDGTMKIADEHADKLGAIAKLIEQMLLSHDATPGSWNTGTSR